MALDVLRFLAVLVLSLTILIIGFGWVVRSTQYNASQTFFWLVAKLLTRFLWRTRLENPFPIQGPGNAVIICNHRTSIDPFFVQVASRRVIHWMVAREYCDHPVLGFFLRIAEVIPVNRGGIDTAATKSAIRLVSEGGMVGMLPEGRINDTDQFMRPVRPGAVLVALKGHAPIIPCYIEVLHMAGVWGVRFGCGRASACGSEHRSICHPTTGEKDDELVRELLVQCVKAIAALAGRPDFEPRVAGRDWRRTDWDLQPGANPSA